MIPPSDNLLGMLCDLMGALSKLTIRSQNIEDFLQGAVSLVAKHLCTPACSIYLRDEATDEMVLRATAGKAPDTAGLPAEAMAVTNGPGSGFLPFSDAAGSPCKLSIPISNGAVKIGALEIQHTAPGFFDQAGLTALKATAAQLVPLLENARLVMELQRVCAAPKKSVFKGTLLQGEPVSGGWAMGPCIMWEKSHVRFLSDTRAADQGGLNDFYAAIQKTTEQLDFLQQRCADRLPESASLIFAAHFMILKDPAFSDRMARSIRDGKPATRAVREVARQYIQRLKDSVHPYIREKACDVEDLAGRLLGNLLLPEAAGDMDSNGKIVIACTLYPSELLRLAVASAAGIVLVNGGVASHVAIISRSLKIPLVVIQYPDFVSFGEDTRILVDGDSGTVHVDPPDALVSRFESRAKVLQKWGDAAPAASSDAPALTRDGAEIGFYANINLLSELPLAQKVGAHGIGLYRTEFPFLMRPSFPSESEQYFIYRQVNAAMPEKPLIFRTLDIGGDKNPAYANTAVEANPELGLRSIRFSLKHKDLFAQQIRAILRAAADSKVLGIMFPLISSIDDFRRAKQVVQSCLDQLQQEKSQCHPHPQVGMMIELPAVAETMPEYAAECDFFSIGTNDFVQYMLAVDRSNKQVTDYYRHDHPAVLRALARIVKAACDHKKPISICGEMAHDAEMIPFLLGIGLRRFSVDPQFIPMLRQTVAGLSLDDCRTYADILLSAGSIETVRAISRRKSIRLAKQA